MNYYKIDGLILYKKNIKEKSAIVYILTQNLGIIKGKIDGLNRSESKLISIIQPGNFGNFFLSSELTFFKILSFLPYKIPSKVFKKFPYTYLWALKFLILFNFLSTSPKFFETIVNLDRYLLKNKSSFLIWYLKIIFEELGVLPNLTHCSECGKLLSGNVYYQGSKFYCYKCRKISYDRINFTTYKLMISFLKEDRLLDLKNKFLREIFKKIFKNHLKEISL
ncbi:MAG: DNA repair protein RecO [Patescibacteria group bacterium]|nr:DNA repair protein RecO [Patescibacteria group bacterium]